MQAGRPELAETICRDHLVLNPSSLPHLQLLAHALIKLNRLEEAEKEIRFAISITPDFPALHEDLGSLHAMKGDYDAAIECFQRAIQMDPRLAGVHKKLAHALVAAGRNTEVDSALESYLDHDEDAALVTIAVEHWRAGRTEEAEDCLRKALRKNSKNVDAMRFLALVYQGKGKKLSDAEALLRRATDIAPDFHQALSNLGQILVDNGKWTDAIEIYQRLVKLTPDEETAWSGLGRSLSHSGDVEKALEAYQKALIIKPDSPGINMAYAHTLKTVGRQTEAISAYRDSIKYKPELGESYWSMANLKIFRFESDEVSTMENQLANSELSESSRIHFHFSLGKAYEDQKDYKRAWDNYHKGNQLQRPLIDYDPVEHEVYLQRIKSTFNHEFISSHTIVGHDAKDPIFIVGLPRSGSTLVEQILASHSQVEGTSELPNLESIATSTGKYRSDKMKYPETMSTLTERDWAAYGKEYLQQVARHRTNGTPFFIDKMPNNFAHIGWIKLILPNAKIINTRRHPMDSCLGAYKQLFGKGQNFTYEMFELAEYYRCYVDIMDHWHSVLPGQILDVHYEETVTDLEYQVRKILQYCGLPFEEQCLKFYETDRAVKTASSEQVRQPIYTGALGLWKKYGDNMLPWQEDLEDILDSLPAKVINASG
ncbi:MAG: sulfotransferase [Pseudomonadales bacterium]